jgi:hypothetical protein
LAPSGQLISGTKNSSRSHLSFWELKLNCLALVPKNEKKRTTEILMRSLRSHLVILEIGREKER